MQSLIDKTLAPCKTALKDLGFSAAEINEVVLSWWNDKNAKNY